MFLPNETDLTESNLYLKTKKIKIKNKTNIILYSSFLSPRIFILFIIDFMASYLIIFVNRYYSHH